ncbi:hypothetical protein CHLRE_06g293750v5 [Chlamydomonas reinhardtii]|uniref:C3H1-type domain-containing protein n=1 Tax=Chlamydomonas reinhardtii TaxID=3055 RepID=A0A2K3DQK7_CHLRE|nr:uncharacterized protein CHLRE_06g293750v5 [Chlamydomonas reinhardtii]PNW82778.1 hypothetical protein CHLRE_06g293750v5 [Chlamydomonas reinhardtii]
MDQYQLAQLQQRFQEVNLSGGVDQGAMLKSAGDLLSSAEATTQYSSSESSSGADNLNQLDSSSLLDTGMLATARQSDGARSTGQPSQEGKAQICFDFTKGVCSRGDKCKYSHDLATIVHFNSKEKGICFDYLRNQCHRGLLCRFSHDLSNIAQQCQVNNGVARGPAQGAKPNAICYDFVKGVCQRGAECRYSHDLSLIARMARGGSAQPKAGEVCYDYLRGRCNRGATCKYSHNIAFLAAPGFLGNAMSSDGVPMAAQAPGGHMSAGGAPPLGPMPVPGGPGFMGMGGMSGMGPRPLHTALSADQATLSHVLAAAGPGAVSQMLAAQAAAQQSNGLAAEAADGRRRSNSLNGDMGNDTLAVNDQPHWNAKGLAMAQHAAIMQRMAGMAAAAGMQQAFGGGMGQGMPGRGMPPGADAMSHLYGKPPPSMGSYGGHDTSAGMRRPPLPPGGGSVPAEFAALLAAGGMADSHALYAETIKAQLQAQQGARMVPNLSGGGAPPMMAAAPQPIPGRDSQGYDVAAAQYAQQGGSQSGGGAPSSDSGSLSRSAPSAGAPVNPDLLPMIKEIWSKPGQIAA